MHKLNEVYELIKFAKSHGISRLSYNGLEFEFAPSIPQSVLGEGENMPSDDEMMYYSADSPIQVPK